MHRCRLVPHRRHLGPDHRDRRRYRSRPPLPRKAARSLRRAVDVLRRTTHTTNHTYPIKFEGWLACRAHVHPLTTCTFPAAPAALGAALYMALLDAKLPVPRIVIVLLPWALALATRVLAWTYRLALPHWVRRCCGPTVALVLSCCCCCCRSARRARFSSSRSATTSSTRSCSSMRSHAPAPPDEAARTRGRGAECRRPWRVAVVRDTYVRGLCAAMRGAGPDRRCNDCNAALSARYALCCILL